MSQAEKVRLLEVRGARGLEMPLRVLGLVSQLGLCPDRIAIASRPEEQSLEALLRVSAARGALLVEKLSAMVLVRSAMITETEADILATHSAISFYKSSGPVKAKAMAGKE